MTLKYKQDREYLDKLLRYCLRRWHKAECQAHSGPVHFAIYAARANKWFAACDRVARLSRIAS